MWIKHFTDLASLLVLAALVLMALWGWGRAGTRLLLGGGDTDRPATELWLGWALIVAGVHGLNFLVPINGWLALGFFATGLIWLWHLVPVAAWVRWRTAWQGAGAGRRAAMGLLGLAAMCVLGSQAMLPPANYDSGLYHLQSVRWANEYPLVQGLGNLHGRLAFNQSYFGWVALLNVFPWWGHGHGLAALTMALASFGSVMQLWRSRVRAGGWLGFFLTAALVMLSRRAGFSSPSPDVAVALLQVTILAMVCGILYAGESADAAGQRGALVTLLVLCTVAVTVKPSIALFATVALLVCARQAIRAWHGARAAAWKAVALCAVIGVVHLARGYWLSGMPLYPSVAGRWGELPWAVSASAAQHELAWIRSWARAPGISPELVLASSDWVDPWLSRVLASQGWMLLAVLGLPVLGWWLRLLGPTQTLRELGPGPEGRWLYAPLVAGVASWLVTAPDLRFLGAMPELLLAVSAWMFGQQLVPLLQRLGVPARVLAAVATVAVALLLVGFLVRKLPLAGWLPFPELPLQDRTTASGLQLRIGSDQCWDAPLPCTPYFNDALRTAGGHDGQPDLGSGFRQGPVLAPAGEQR